VTSPGTVGGDERVRLFVALRPSAVFFFAATTRGFAALVPVARRGGRAAAARATFGRAGAATGAAAGLGGTGSRGRSGPCVRETSVKRICSPIEW